MQLATAAHQLQSAPNLRQPTQFRVENRQGRLYLTKNGHSVGRVAGILLDRDGDSTQQWLFSPAFDLPAPAQISGTLARAKPAPTPRPAGRNRAAARHARNNLRVEPLTPRELEVLQLVAAGLSTRQIAAELVITAGTVKKHIATIFGKLGVNRRTQAIAVAREMELL